MGPRREISDREQKIKPNPGKAVTPQQWGRFLARYAETGNITRSAEYAGTTRMTVYKRRKDDPVFDTECIAAYEIAVEAMEEECQRRAFSGFTRDIYWQGEVVGHETVFSDSLAMFLLKGAKPEKYRDRVSTDNLNTNLNATTEEDVEALREGIRAKLFR